MNEFEADVFETLIKNVVDGRYDEANTKKLFVITFVFSANRNTLSIDMEFIVLYSFNMKSNIYAFEKNRFVERFKVAINGIPIKVAIENE